MGAKCAMVRHIWNKVTDFIVTVFTFSFNSFKIHL